MPPEAQTKILTYQNLTSLAGRLRDDLTNGHQNFVLLYAFNGIGKTRLSMEFKNKRNKDREPNTLYFNSHTEDLFTWQEDPDDPNAFTLRIDTGSRFFDIIQQNTAFEVLIKNYFYRYHTAQFKIDYENKTIQFSREELIQRGNEPHLETIHNIKISRGEQSIFVWCFFLAIIQLVIDGNEAYHWVKYIFIDDPISSLDDNNVIALASDLIKLLTQTDDLRIPTAITTHHGLFFNIICNEVRKEKHKQYFLYRKKGQGEYFLRSTDATPFFHHVAMINELIQVNKSGMIYTYHFNMLRQVLEKTSSFFGFSNFSDCIDDLQDNVLFARAVNLLSHGNYSIYEPIEMTDDNKNLFSLILTSYLKKYKFQLPDLQAVDLQSQA